MKPTDILKNEHKAILLTLEVVESVSKKLDAGENVPAEHLTKVVDFIRGFADKCHHAKEEDLLFPAMERTGRQVMTGDWPIGKSDYFKNHH